MRRQRLAPVRGKMLCLISLRHMLTEFWLASSSDYSRITIYQPIAMKAGFFFSSFQLYNTLIFVDYRFVKYASNFLSYVLSTICQGPPLLAFCVSIWLFVQINTFDNSWHTRCCSINSLVWLSSGHSWVNCALVISWAVHDFRFHYYTVSMMSHYTMMLLERIAND